MAALSASMIGTGVFDSDTLIMMRSSLDAAWGRLQASGMVFDSDSERDEARELLAECLIEAAHAGERDGVRLCDQGLARFSTQLGQRARFAAKIGLITLVYGAHTPQ